jgi:archaetidylinositol phosphate synthase
MEEIREHLGWLRGPEQALIRRLIGYVPQRLSPDHLTFIAFIGALLAAGSILACWISQWMLLPFYIGLFANWFGDSFDGAIARKRKIERPKAGFLIDRGCDTLCFVAILAAFAMSPYILELPGFLLLVGYLVNSLGGTMRVVADRKQIIGLAGVGGTEGRLIIGLWVAVFALAGLKPGEFHFLETPNLKALALVPFIGFLSLFAFRVYADVKRLTTQIPEESENQLLSVKRPKVPLELKSVNGGDLLRPRSLAKDRHVRPTSSPQLKQGSKI